MSSEWGLFGLARRTYSSYRPPDTISVRLFRFMFRFCSKTIPERGRRNNRALAAKNSSPPLRRTPSGVTNPTSACWAQFGN